MKTSCLIILLLLTVIPHAQTNRQLVVYFDFDKYDLNRKSRAILDSFASSYRNEATKQALELHGHCDAIGSDYYNLQLSEKRVLAVKQYLESSGISSDYITISLGHGENMPLNQNLTAEQRQLNRRVEIKWISAKQPVVNPNNNEEIQQKDTLSLKNKIADSSVISGSNIILQNINFYGGRHRFLPASTPMLEELLDAMQTYPNLVIRVEGHICCQPHTGDGHDMETGLNNLSEARAKAVMDYLFAQGIAADRISYKGFGHSAPIYPYPEQNEQERMLNRRVEIKIIRK